MSTADFWPTFGHDQHHTGCDSASAITPENVQRLHKVWQYSQPNQINGGPIAVNGSIYVSTLGAGTVIDLNASSGDVAWSTTIGASATSSRPFAGEITQTPVYANGLLFVGVHGYGVQTPAGWWTPVPSSIFALRASTGGVVWSAPLNGNVRASPAVAQGNVFVPYAGGDPPFCLQGGVSAFDQQTGRKLWDFFVDPTPADGGSVWAPLAYDGTRLIFGTGNTCTQAPLSANAIVAIDPTDGAVDWELNTAPQLTDDVGAGALIVNDMVVTMRKNGLIYYVDEATGAILHQTQTGVADGSGGNFTPASDGETIIVGTSAATSVSTGAVTRARGLGGAR